MRESQPLSLTHRYAYLFVLIYLFMSINAVRAAELGRSSRHRAATHFDQIQSEPVQETDRWQATSQALPAPQPRQLIAPQMPFPGSTAPQELSALGDLPAPFDSQLPEAQRPIEQTSYLQLPPLTQPQAPLFVPSNLGPTTEQDGFSIAVGFDFLQPSWSNDSFQQLLPGTTAALFPGLNLDTKVDHDFGLSPRIDVGLGASDSEYGLSAGFNTVNLSGSLRQNTAGMASNDSIDAQSAINILSVNLPEVSRVISLDIFEDDQIDEAMLELRVGTRYSALNQIFTAALRQGSGSAVTTSSFHDFRGVGLTAAANLSLPVTNAFWLYGNSRGSMLLGRNERQSNYSVVVAGGGPGTISNTVTEDKTDIIPVGEFETGIVWDLAEQFCDEGTDPSNLVWLKLGFVAQVWGDVGLVSAGTGQPFREGSLWLKGFTFQAGVAY
jgi:hypothetical protein